LNLPLKSLEVSPNYRWWIYFAIAIGTFITVVEQSATAIVIPSIAEEFGADIPMAQWLTVGSMLAVSAMMMPAGAIANTLGRRRVWICGLLLFSVASLITSVAPNFVMMLTGKVLMGLSASALQANGMAMVAGAFPDSERGKASGLHMTSVGIGAMAGPLLGGGMESLMGWRSIFIFITLFSLVSCLVASLILHADHRHADHRGDNRKGPSLSQFDWIGTALSATLLLAFMLTVTFGQKLGWFSGTIIVGLVLTVILFVMFVVWERRTPFPMLPLSLFNKLAFSVGSGVRFLAFMATTSTFFLIPFFLISVVGMETGLAALYLLPSSISLMVAGPISGRIADKIGTTIPSFIGLCCCTAAMYLFSVIKLDSDFLIIAAASGLSGMGISIFMAPNTSFIMGSGGRGHYGIVSAFMNLTRNSAHIIGIAIPTAIVVGVMGSMGYEADLSDPESLNDVGLRTAYTLSMNRAYQASMVIMASAGILSLLPFIYRRFVNR
jgi:EmrB/QacA subfamily drug resistance transporter